MYNGSLVGIEKASERWMLLALAEPMRAARQVYYRIPPSINGDDHLPEALHLLQSSSRQLLWEPSTNFR